MNIQLPVALVLQVKCEPYRLVISDLKPASRFQNLSKLVSDLDAERLGEGSRGTLIEQLPG